MDYNGTIRVDMGPMLPHADSIKAIERNGINGMECAVSTVDFGKIAVEAFDDYAILNIMNASDRGTKFHYLISPFKTPKEMIYTATGDLPEFGILGDPIRAVVVNKTLYKAIAVHGQVKESGKVQAEGYHPLLIMKIAAQNLSVSAAIKFSAANQDMRNLNLHVLNGLDPWVKISGYGDISFIKVDGKRRVRVYINNIKHFTIAPNYAADWGRADPVIVRKLYESAR